MILTPSARWLPLVALAFAAPAGCGSSVEPHSPVAGPGSSHSPSGPASDEAVAKHDQSDQEANKLIDEMLAGLPGSDRGAARAPAAAVSPPRTPQAAVASPSEAPARPARPAANSADSFDEDVRRIRETVPTWDNGTGVTARFLNEGSGERMSLIYVDTTPPEFNAGGGYWVIQAKAKVNGEVVGHVLFLMKSLSPGRYEGSAQKKDVAFASLMGSPTWEGKSPRAAWSVNQNSWVEVVLREGRRQGELEGNFRAKLFTNDGQSYQTVESGYFYVKR